MSTVMLAASTLLALDIDRALAAADDGAAFVDLRPTEDYLDVHIPGSLALLYEAGPGMASRARDCIPLEVPLLLLADDRVDMMNAAASLRGKGFSVIGVLEDGVTAWAQVRGTPASVDVVSQPLPSQGVVLDVGDPGAAEVSEAIHLPIEHLWTRVDELPADQTIVILAGFGVRAALAVGILERAGCERIVFLNTLGRAGRPTGPRLSP